MFLSGMFLVVCFLVVYSLWYALSGMFLSGMFLVVRFFVGCSYQYVS